MTEPPESLHAGPLPERESESSLDALLASLPPDDAERVRAVVRRSRLHEERLQLLQLIATSLARSLDEDEIIQELTRGVQRAVRCDGVLVARVDIDRALVEVVRHVVRDEERGTRLFALGRGVLAEAALTGAAVLVSPYDAATSALAAADDVVAGAGAVQSVLAIPMMHGRRLLGVVAVHDECIDAFDTDTREMLTTLATHAAGALCNARLFADSERERRQSEAMAQIARAVGESLRMGEVLRLILRHALALLQGEGACIALRRDEYLHIVSGVGTATVFSGVHLPVTGSLIGRVAATGSAVVNNAAQSDPEMHRPSLRLVAIHKTVIVPLVTARGIIGAIVVFNRSDDFTADDARVLQRLADQVAVAIVNARLFEEVQDATREWSAAFESIGVGMCIVDDAGKITRFNSRALQLANRTVPQTLMGLPFYDAVLGAPPRGDDDPLERAIRDGAQGRAVCAGGNGWMDVVAAPHPNGGAIVTFDAVDSERVAGGRTRLLVDAMADAMCTIDRDGCLASPNPAALELFGRTDVAGARWVDLVLPELADEAAAHVQHAFAGHTQRNEYILVRGDGDRRVVIASLAPVREGDAVTDVVASISDVTRERRAQGAVALSEARYRHLFDAASDAVFTLDFRAVFTSANPSTCEVLLTPSDQLLGRSFFPHVAPEDVDRVTTSLRDALGGEARRLELAVVRRMGTTRQLSLTVTPIRSGRTTVGLLAVARDVTADRASAEAIRVGEARYAQLVELSADAIFTLDEEGRFTSVNRVFEAVTGRGRDDTIGDHFTVVLDERDRDGTWEVFVATLHGRGQRRELRFVDRAGASRWGRLTTAPICVSGRVVGVLGVVRDVTEERRWRDAMRGRAPLGGGTLTADPRAAGAGDAERAPNERVGSERVGSERVGSA